VVRRTNSKFILQVIYSNMNGDMVMTAAESTELVNHGLSAGLTNYSAAYATGLLIARRLLKKVGLSDLYKVNDEVNGEYFNVDESPDDDKRPFKVFLDVGIQRTTTGARVFGALKGACDGGLNVPHNTKRFPGYTRAKIEEVVNKRGKATGEVERMDAKFDPLVLRDRIYGAHVTNYMNALKKDDAAKFKRQFGKWEKALTAAKVKTCEELYKKVHASVIAKPDRIPAKGNKNVPKLVSKVGDANRVYSNTKGAKWPSQRKLTNEEKKAAVNAKFATLLG
jgi:large subunit ribosomal protein L5e